jgi:hypothetical protein
MPQLPSTPGMNGPGSESAISDASSAVQSIPNDKGGPLQSDKPMQFWERQVPELPQRALNPDEPIGLAGVGIVIERLKVDAYAGTGKTVIRSIQPLSSADREGSLRQGDELLAINGLDVSGRDMENIKRLLAGRNGSSCELRVKQLGGSRVSIVPLMRGCLEWWEMYDRVLLVEQQLAESESSAQEFRSMWMAEAKESANVGKARDKIANELDRARASLEGMRRALDVAEKELAGEITQTSQLRTELSRTQAQVAAAGNREQDAIRRAQEAEDENTTKQAMRVDFENQVLKLEQEVAASNLQVSNLKDQQEAWIQRKNEFESESCERH